MTFYRKKNLLKMNVIYRPVTSTCWTTFCSPQSAAASILLYMSKYRPGFLIFKNQKCIRACYWSCCISCSVTQVPHQHRTQVCWQVLWQVKKAAVCTCKKSPGAAIYQPTQRSCILYLSYFCIRTD